MATANQPRSETHVRSAQWMLQQGCTRNELRKLRRDSEITLLHRGWYATGQPAREVALAVQTGGVLTCVSLVNWLVHGRSHGHIHAGRFHARRTRGCCRLLPRFERFLEPRPGNGCDTAWNCALFLLSCPSVAEAEAHIEALVHHRFLSKAQVRSLQQIAPVRYREMLRFVTGVSESYLEVMMRRILRKAHIKFLQQVWLDELNYRVDFLIGHWLVVEVDGRQFHAGAENFESDRRRDARLTAHGFRVLRFSYSQIMSEPERCLAAVLSVIQGRRRHVRR